MPQQDNVVYVWDPVTKQDVPLQSGGVGGLGLSGPPVPPPETPERAAEMDTALETFGQGAATALDVGSLILPFLKSVSPIMKLVGASGLGAGSGALRGGQVSEPGLGGALEGAVTGGALQGSMNMAPKASQFANRAAYRLGGFSKKEAGRAEKSLREVNKTLAADRTPLKPRAFWRDRPVSVGSEGRVDDLVSRAGNTVEETRKQDPAMHSLWETFQGSADPLFEEAINTRAPVDSIKDIESRLNTFLGQQARVRGKRPGQDLQLMTDELGELETGLKHSPASKNLRTARDSKEIVTASEQSLGQFDQAIANASKGARYRGEGPSGPMSKADREYAALKRVQTDNAMMRAPEMVTDPGKMAARGGLGAGVGRTAGTLIGAGAGTYTGGLPGALIGSALGNLLLSPTGASLTGQAGASLMEALPMLLRFERMMESGQDTLEPAKPKRRSPR